MVEKSMVVGCLLGWMGVVVCSGAVMAMKELLSLGKTSRHAFCSFLYTSIVGVALVLQSPPHGGMRIDEHGPVDRDVVGESPISNGADQHLKGRVRDLKGQLSVPGHFSKAIRTWGGLSNPSLIISRQPQAASQRAE